MDAAEYMLFPRLAVVAEAGWTHNRIADWQIFRKKLSDHLKRLDAARVNYYKSPFVRQSE